MRGAFGDDELRIYANLVEGKPQTVVRDILQLDKSKISRTTQKLLKNKFLMLKVEKGVKIYCKGPNGSVLDDEILKRSISFHARSVAPFSPDEDNRRANVHHMKYRFKVVAEGDLYQLIEEKAGRRLEYKFLRKIKPLNGLECYTGQLPYMDQWVTVDYQVAKRTGEGWLYVHVPKIELTREELRAKKHEEYAKTVCMDISTKISRLGRWQLGIPELCEKWKTHFGFKHPTLANYSDKMFLKSQNGDTWTSDSEGETELETSNPEYAQLLVDMPGEVIKIRVDMRHIADALMEMANAVRAAKDLHEEVSASLIDIQAKVDEVRISGMRGKVPVNGEPERAEAKMPGDYDGVMFQ